MLDLCEAIAQQRVEAAQVAALPIAKIGSMLAEEATPNEFMVFPIETPTRLSKRTALDFIWALREGLIPDRMIQACGELLPEIYKLAGIEHDGPEPNPD